ncbi:hypothetical protein HanRHA438_Chr04g0188301 [Helianthus annuus]|nr:hypothetical protein HanRHA438_Chr04g0188301 [Helianthus annuus]
MLVLKSTSVNRGKSSSRALAIVITPSSFNSFSDKRILTSDSFLATINSARAEAASAVMSFPANSKTSRNFAESLRVLTMAKLPSFSKFK